MKTFKKFIAEELLSELTISPDYKQKNEFNPYYTLDDNVIKSTEEFLDNTHIDGVDEYDEIMFQNVDSGKGKLAIDFGGKYIFQIVLLVSDKKVSTKYFIKTTKSTVKSHYGQQSRKNSTASSDVNEFLSLYFLKNPTKSTAFEWMKEVGGLTGGTGVYRGEGDEVTYEHLKELLDADDTAERDIEIGLNNAKEVKKDLGKSWSKLYWTPRGKPDGISKGNPSDVIVQLKDGSYIGYSNKIASGKDVTPKFNTNIWAFFSKLGNNKFIKNSISWMDDAWKTAEGSVPKKLKKSVAALNRFDITKEKPSESSSKRGFADIAKTFIKDKLNFYGEDFYHIYRNELIKNLGSSLKKSNNLVYFLNTIAFYTFDDPNTTPCPYKLLIGSTNGSILKDVSTNEDLRNLLLNKDSSKLKAIKFEYDGKSQQFKLKFRYEDKNINIPITCRTRAAGGWQGKSLFITTPGVEIT